MARKRQVFGIITLAIAAGGAIAALLFFNRIAGTLHPEPRTSHIRWPDGELNGASAAKPAASALDSMTPYADLNKKEDLLQPEGPSGINGAREPAGEELPEEINRLRVRAYHSAKSGKLEKAVELILEALKKKPDSPRLQRETSHLFAMRGFRSLQNGAHDRALGFFREALYYWKDNQQAIRGMGITYYRKHDRGRAEKWLLKFVDNGGDRPGVYTLLGRINYERDRLEDALYYFRVSLSVSPEQPEISELAEKIRREIKVEGDFYSDESRHFHLKYEGTASPAISSMVLHISEEAYMDVGSAFGFYPEFPVTIILYTDKQFSTVTQSPAWAEAIFDGKIRIPVQGLSDRSRTLERLIYHEFTHALVHEVGGGRAPIWLHEGLAQSMEGVDRDVPSIAKKVTDGGGPFPLSSLEDSFLDMPSEKAKAAYRESWLAIRFLDEYYGPFVESEMLDSLHHGGDIRDAVERVSSREYKEVDREFARWVKRQAGEL